MSTPIQEVIEDLLLPTLFGQSEPLPNEVCRLATLATGQGGLGIPDLRSEAPQQFAASRLIATVHVDSITESHYGARRKIYGGAKEASTITQESKC